MSDTFLSMTAETYRKINSLPGKRKQNALVLLMFYCYHANFQRTDTVHTTLSFCSSGLELSLPTARKAKRDLEDLGIIENIPASGRFGKAYVKINFIEKGII